MTLKLYTNPFSRGNIVEWYLDELELPYENIKVEWANKPADLYKVNPAGKVPALQDGDINVSETLAILWYLADKHGRLPKDLKERTAVLQWLSYAATEANGVVANKEKAPEAFPKVMSVLEGALSQREYIAGDAFSIADVLLSPHLDYIPIMYREADFGPYPHLQAYRERMHKRPACAKHTGVFRDPSALPAHLKPPAPEAAKA